ncbi:MAG: DUF3090 family protein [Thermomicrobiales bacterium]
MPDDPFVDRVEGDAERLSVEALGEPGDRRFRLLAVVSGDTHIIWLEKQQVFALGRAIEQVLESLPDLGPELNDVPPIASFDPATNQQFRAGRMELGFDESRNRLVIIAHDVEMEDVGPRLTFRLTRGQARDFSAEAAAVVAAGRPLCPLCGQPMGQEPHVCPEQNGHLPHSVDELGIDGEPEIDDSP